MDKPTVAVIFGSRTTEHDVSIITALPSIIKPLKLTQKYNVVPVYIDKTGKWFCDPVLADLNFFTSGKINQYIDKHRPISIEFNNGLNLIKTGLRNQVIEVDVVFPALHGTHGEDGEVMALCELANIPYVGCDASSSSIAMDKITSKQVVLSDGILTPKFVSFMKNEFEANKNIWLNKIEDSLKYPLFVKPSHLGSSIGIAKVLNRNELENSLEVALYYDDKALAEEAVDNLIEVTLPIMGNNLLTPALLERPILHAEDFFDFETKYMQGGKKGKNETKNGAQAYSELPAKLPQHLYKLAEKTGLEAYRALGCSGIARIDMLIDAKTEKVYFNEVNPLPGGLYSHNWNQAGISNVELVTKLVDLAYEKFNAKKDLTRSFETSYLNQF
jgi:D-alanine-D-alanine ligase